MTKVQQVIVETKPLAKMHACPPLLRIRIRNDDRGALDAVTARWDNANDIWGWKVRIFQARGRMQLFVSMLGLIRYRPSLWLGNSGKPGSKSGLTAIVFWVTVCLCIGN